MTLPSSAEPDLAPAVAAVAIHGLVKSYRGRGLPALDEVTLRVDDGELVALMGASGSGKSTLLNLIGALDTATSGAIHVFGRPLGQLSDAELTTVRRETIGFVFQQFHLVPTLTALENVITPMIADRRIRQRADLATRALADVGLSGKERQLPGQLSGGEQQRVAVARALVMQPRLLLADEPTGNLDARTGAEILDLLLRLRSERQMTVILATHDAAVALHVDRVIALADGHIIHDLTVRPDHTPASLLADLDVA